MPTHFVCKRGYWEEYESYRDERGRPRKRFVKYWGKRDPRRRWGGLGPIETDGVDWNKLAEDELVRMAQEENAYEMFRELQSMAFKEETGLDLPHSPPGDPVPIDKPPSNIDLGSTAPAQSSPSEQDQEMPSPADDAASPDDGDQSQIQQT